MNHAELLAQVVSIADGLGILAYYNDDSRRATAGFPDLVLAGHDGVIFAELKTGGDQIKSIQARWRWRLKAAGMRYHEWKPADLDNGNILRVLKGIA
jgi:hypothetical protein